MKKFFSLIAAVLFAGSMMAAEAVLQYTGGVTANMVGNGENNAATLGLDADLFTVLADKGSNQNLPGLNQANDIRLYADKNSGNGNIITVSIASGTITSIVLDIKQTATFVVKAGETALTEGGRAYAINAASFSIQNTTTGATTQLRLNKITITYENGDVPPTPTVNYYVAGNMNEWKANDAYMLTPSNNGEYKGEFTFVANAEFKVIGFDGETTTWFPEGMDNNFQITEAGDYKITFNPAGNVEGWYEGFFNVVKKEEPVIPQYEVAEAIAAGLTDNTEIMVRGIITKMEFKGANFAKYGSVNIYVADATDAEGEFEFFNCYSLNADTFRTSIPNYDPTDKNWAQFREVVDAKGNAIHVGDTVIAFGKYKLYNSKHELNTGCYLVDIKSAPVAPAQDVDITIADGSFSDYVESYGYWMVEAQNVDYYISLSNDNTQITQAAGTYTAADLYAEDSYILTETDSISFVSGSIVLAVDAEGVATVTGSLVGNDGKTYNLNITSQAPDPHMYDEDSDFNRNFASYTIDDQYLADDGDLMIIAKDESGYQIVLDLYVPTGATGLTAGAYPINDTYEANSVAAGMYDSGNIYASYAGKGDSEGLSNVWYLVSGTVTVDENLNITIDALNSLGHSVKATLSADSGTGIEETLAAGKAAKTLRNGHILILKGDKTYNVLGTRIR